MPRVGRAFLSPYTSGELASLSGDRTRPIRFGSDELSGYSSELIATLSTFRRRLWLYRSLLLLARTGVLVLVVVFLFRLLDIVGVLPQPIWLPLLLGAVALGGVGLALGQHVSYLEVARVVDRQLGLKAQLGTAVELTLEGEPTRLARSQVRQATTIARRLSARQAVTPRGPWRDLRLAGVALAGLLVISVLNSVGVRAARPDAVDQAALAAIDPSLNSWHELDPQTAAELSMGASQSSTLQAAVDNLKQQLDTNQITPLEYQKQVAAIEDQIRQQAQESAQQQTALGDLAQSLADSSSTQGAADALNRGDYADAVKQLSDLAGQTGQLSDQARQDLADKLAEAATNTAPSNQALSAAAQKASQALASGDAAASEQALKDLASQVASASEKVAPQSDLGKALQQAQAAQGDTSQNGDPQAGPQNGAQSGTDQSGDPTGSQDGQSGAGQGTTPSSAAAQAANGTGGAGSTPGEKITAADPTNQALKPDAGSNVLKITGQASGSGTRIQSGNPSNPPVTASSSGTATVQSSGTSSSEQVSAVGEANNVPLDLRSIVRDYFTGSDRP